MVGAGIDLREDAVGGGDAGLGAGPELAEVSHGLLGQEQGGEEAAEGIGRETGVQRLPARSVEDGGNHGAHEEFGQWRGGGAQPHGLQQGAQSLLQAGPDPVDDMFLQAISLDDAARIHGLGQGDGKIAGFLHAAGGGAAHRAAQPLHRPGNRRGVTTSARTQSCQSTHSA